VPVTPYHQPNLPWRRLADLPHIVFAVVPRGNGVYIYMYSERNRAVFERPCSNPQRAAIRALDWGRQWGG